MAKQNKVSGKVQNKGNGNYKIDKGNGPDEVDVDIDLKGSNNFEVDKLETDTLPKTIEDPDTKKPVAIRWFNNFSIKENGKYIKKKYTVKIDQLQAKLGNGKLVIYSDTHTPPLYYYDGTINGDSFDLDDGDPGAGAGP